LSYQNDNRGVAGPSKSVNRGEHLPLATAVNCVIFPLRDEQLASKFRR